MTQVVIPFRALTYYIGGVRQPGSNAYTIANNYAKEHKMEVISVQYQGGHQGMWTMTLEKQK